MSDNDISYAPPPPGYSPPPPGAAAPPRPPLRRTSGGDKVIGGVSGGIARTLGIDPILVRVAFVILTIFGGSGIVLYVAGWLFIPEDGRADSTGEKFFRDNNALAVVAAVVVGCLVVGPMLAWGMWDGGIGFGGVVLLLLVVAAVVALSRRGNPAAAANVTGATAATASTENPAAASDQGPQATAVVPTDSAPTAVIERPTTPIPPVAGPPPAPPAPPASPHEFAPPPPPAPPKEKSVLGRLTLGVALLVAGAMVALDLAGAISVSVVTVLASALTVVAAGLLVGAFIGRSRGLIAMGVGLVLVLIPLSAVPDGINWNTGDGAGDQTYRVRSGSDLEPDYSLGAGKLTLDLRALQIGSGPADGAVVAGTTTDVDVSVGAGEVVVLLPTDPDIPVSVNAEAGVGAIDLPSQPERGGVGVDDTWQRVIDQSGAATASLPGLHLTLSSGLGKVTVLEGPSAVPSSSQKGEGQR